MSDAQDARTADLRLLVHAHGPALRDFIARSERNSMDADETWADVFNLAYEQLHRLSKLSPVQTRSWLCRTARYLAANRYRRAATRQRLQERLRREPLPFVATPEEEILQLDDLRVGAEMSAHIREVLANLPADHRRVLVLHALGKTGPAIARELGITPGSARKRLMRSREAFRTAFVAAKVRRPNERPPQAMMAPDRHDLRVG